MLSFGTYLREDFSTHSLLRSDSQGRLEIEARAIGLKADPAGIVAIESSTDLPVQMNVDGVMTVLGRGRFQEPPGQRRRLLESIQDQDADLIVGGQNASAILSIQSKGRQSSGLRIGSEGSEEAFGVYSFGGGEQVMIAQGEKSVMEFTTEYTKIGGAGAQLQLGDENTTEIMMNSGTGDLELRSAGKVKLAGEVEIGHGGDSNATVVQPIKVEKDGTVALGETITVSHDAQNASLIAFDGTITGPTPLSFSGKGGSGAVTSLKVDEPEGYSNVITVPDSNGTFMVSAQAPLYVNERGGLNISLGEVTEVGALSKGTIAPGFGNIDIGGSSLSAGNYSGYGVSRFLGDSKFQGSVFLEHSVSIDHIVGEFPLAFEGKAVDTASIRIQVEEPSRTHTIKLPASDGLFAVNAGKGLELLEDGTVKVHPPTLTRVGALEEGSITATFGDIMIGNSHFHGVIVGGEMVRTFGDIDVPNSKVEVSNALFKKAISNNPLEDQQIGALAVEFATANRKFLMSATPGQPNECTTDGCSASFLERGFGNGAHVEVSAGDASAAKTLAGSVRLSAGESSSTQAGTGGSVGVAAGNSRGTQCASDACKGGEIQMSAGNLPSSSGGQITIGGGFNQHGGAGEHHGGGISIESGKAEGAGRSGALTLSTGSTARGESGGISVMSGLAGSGLGPSAGDPGSSGDLFFGSGDSTAGQSGNISIAGGRSPYAKGSRVKLQGGESEYLQGGSIVLESGKSLVESGRISLRTPAGVTHGSSGDIQIETGDVQTGRSGAVGIRTGSAGAFAPGSIDVQVGASANTAGSSINLSGGHTAASGATGGNVNINAGDSFAQKGTGGDVVLKAGTGPAPHSTDGGDGGTIKLIAGGSMGSNPDMDRGGGLDFTGGHATSGVGGDVNITSGFSVLNRSGRIAISSSNAGRLGESGAVVVKSGDSKTESSGELKLLTGDSQNSDGGAVMGELTAQFRSGAGTDTVNCSGYWGCAWN